MGRTKDLIPNETDLSLELEGMMLSGEFGEYAVPLEEEEDFDEDYDDEDFDDDWEEEDMDYEEDSMFYPDLTPTRAVEIQNRLCVARLLGII